MSLIFLVLALICFIVRAFNLVNGLKVDLLSLGLAFVVAAMLVPEVLV